MNKSYLSALLITFLFLSFSGYKKEVGFPIEIIELEKEFDFKGDIYINNNLGFRIKIPKRFQRLKEGINSVFFKDKEKEKENISIIFWEKDEETYLYYIQSFKKKKIPKKLFKGLGIRGEIISIKEIKRKDGEIFLFTTKRRNLYITRVEFFPYNKDLQITLVFLSRVNFEEEALKIFSSFSLI
jgi:hypothetical protein